MKEAQELGEPTEQYYAQPLEVGLVLGNLGTWESQTCHQDIGDILSDIILSITWSREKRQTNQTIVGLSAIVSGR